ncbi:hypothetical protein DFA_03550 [Cavenderia fasciculata]|uniref:Uncharacterized protein n=1 Tax=Cavenderia fasciculata TaxID=261658 RepID=F4PHW7_CACFS|nr:uncharacterized protein DFA_03550 [Cavenderia fasciculata]EGG25301.1 hypothetical protein DFA_03550 [Cavenderia fasciculata]|eukprot:XP_004363152.1 hypothetical protein DFA_03550 [Cavenderia fasciculata]
MGITGLKSCLKEIKLNDKPLIQPTFQVVAAPATTTTTTTTDATTTTTSTAAAVEAPVVVPSVMIMPSPAETGNTTLIADACHLLSVSITNNQAKGADFDTLMERDEKFIRMLITQYGFKTILLYIDGFGHEKYGRQKDRKTKRDKFCDGTENRLQNYRFRCIEAPLVQLIEKINKEFEGVSVQLKRSAFEADEQVMHENNLLKTESSVKYVYGDVDYAFFEADQNDKSDLILIFKDESEQLKWFKRSELFVALYDNKTVSDDIVRSKQLAPIYASLLQNDYNKNANLAILQKYGANLQQEGWNLKENGCYYCQNDQVIKSHQSYSCPNYFRMVSKLVIELFNGESDIKNGEKLQELLSNPAFQSSYSVYSLTLLAGELALYETSEEKKKILADYANFRYPDFLLKPDYLDETDFPLIDYNKNLVTASETEKRKQFGFVFVEFAGKPVIQGDSVKKVGEDTYRINKDKIKRIKMGRIHDIIHGNGEIKLNEFRFIANYRYHLFNVWQLARFYGKEMIITKEDLLPWVVSYSIKKEQPKEDEAGFTIVTNKGKKGSGSSEPKPKAAPSKAKAKDAAAGRFSFLMDSDEEN